MAQLSAVIAQLKAMDTARVSGIFAGELAKAARPLAPQVRARILNIPSKGERPYHQPPGLRLRIARCVQAWEKVNGPAVQVGIEMDSSRMPDGQMSIPLGMEGVKRWKHPTFGQRDTAKVWITAAPHPYFYATAGELGPASRLAIDRALENITRQISG